MSQIKDLAYFYVLTASLLKNYSLILLLSVMINTVQVAQAQVIKTRIYLIHGQGSDSRLFSKLRLNADYDTVCLNLPLPEKGETMEHFAQKLIPEIDTTVPFILIGVSLGGMVAAELNDLLHPLQTILISSAKNRSELPGRYKFMRVIPLYKLFPAGFIKASSFIMQPLVEPDRKKEKALFKNMLHEKDSRFLKRSIPLIINWQKTDNNGKQLYHLHGRKDHTIPLRNIKSPQIVSGGSHMMVLTEAEFISEKINEILLKPK